ncbi:MAG: hypothetical protein JWQ33_2261 [Ramlibacter sp.]|nr:hypothetical protein [Ramlibacter sp.]
MFNPFENQRLLTSEGAVWVVRKITRHRTDPAETVLQLVLASGASEQLSDSVDVLSGAWPLWCELNEVIAAEDLPGIVQYSSQEAAGARQAFRDWQQVLYEELRTLSSPRPKPQRRPAGTRPRGVRRLD